MNKLTLSSFYRHNNFMKSVRDGERMIAKSEQELARMKSETTLIKVGDICVSTGKGSRVSGIKCKVLEVGRNGKFIRFLVDWDYLSKSKNHCKTFERLQDIQKIKSQQSGYRLQKI